MDNDSLLKDLFNPGVGDEQGDLTQDMAAGTRAKLKKIIAVGSILNQNDEKKKKDDEELVSKLQSKCRARKGRSMGYAHALQVVVHDLRQGEGSKDAHVRSKDVNGEVTLKITRVSMEYFFMNKLDEAAKENPILVALDEETGELYATAAGRKGVGTDGIMDWLFRNASEDLKSWGGTLEVLEST